MGHAAAGEEQHRRVSVSDEDTRDKILLTRRHAGTPLAAAALGAIGGKRYALDVAFVSKRHDHVFTLD